MTILVTGALGFLGSYVVEHFTNSGYIVIGTDRYFFEKPAKPSTITYDKVLEKGLLPDIVIMCHAGVSSGSVEAASEDLFAANVLFTQKIIKSFPGSFFLYISTASVYKRSSSVIQEESPINPETSYSISKLWGELLVKNTKDYGILRLSSLYGERMKEQTILPIYVKQAMQEGKIKVFGQGKRLQNYFHVMDAVKYIEQMSVKRAKGIYLGVASKEFENIELAQIVQNHTGADLELVGEDRSVSVKYNNSWTRENLNIKQDTNFKTAVKAYIDWRKEQ